MPINTNPVAIADSLCKLADCLKVFIPATSSWKIKLVKKLNEHREIPFIIFYKEYFDNDAEVSLESMVEDLQSWANEFALGISEKGTDGKELFFSYKEWEKICRRFKRNRKKSFKRSYSAFIQCCFPRTTGADKYPYFVLNGGIASGYGKYFSRFLDNQDANVIDEIRRFNSRTDEKYLFSEVNDCSFFNAGIHPPLMQFEIDYPGSCSNYNSEDKIFIKDLVLKYDNRSKEIFLFDKKKKKRVLFFDLSLQDLSNRSKLYKWLIYFGISKELPIVIILSIISELVRRNSSSNDIIFYPRIIFEKRLVLRRMCWEITKSRLPVVPRGCSNAVIFEKLIKWKNDINIPCEFFVRIIGKEKLPADQRKPQYINLKSIIFAKIFSRCYLNINEDQSLVIDEFLPNGDQMLSVGGKKVVTEFALQWCQ